MLHDRMEAHSVDLLSDGSQSRGVIKLLEPIRRMSRWSIRQWLIASRGKPFQNLAQTNCHCGFSEVRALSWSATVQEDAPSAKNGLASLPQKPRQWIHAVSLVGSLSNRLDAFGSFPLRAEAEAVPIKAVCKT